MAMPEGQWAARRDPERLYYANGRPIIRKITIDADAVVPGTDSGIMGTFRTRRYAVEHDTRKLGEPVWVFCGYDMAAVSVAVLDPRLDLSPC